MRSLNNMPIIIWGTKIRKDLRGIVAEKCSVCGETERFIVTDYFEVGHIYYIAFGKGTRIDCVSECTRCRNQFRIAPRVHASNPHYFPAGT
jgi:hypothetical protein